MKNNKIVYFSGVIISVLIIVSVIIFLILQKKSGNQTNTMVEIIGEGNNQNIIEQANNPIDKNVEESEKELEFSEIPEENMAEENSPVEVQSSQKVENSVVEEQIPDPDFAIPIVGDVLRDYAKDKLVYSDTLKEWVTHTGIDIKAPKTSIVKASAKGKITAIKNDPRFGLSVVIQHVNGYSTIYSNLLTAEFVSVGEEVEQGETIGTVGNTAAFEILDEPHLHFEILKDGVQIDPNMYL